MGAESPATLGEIPPRVLITGAGGLIGRTVTKHLCGLGVVVTALSQRWDFDPAATANRVFTGDAGDVALVARALGDVDAVVHLAAIPSPRLGTPLEVFAGNTRATFNVLSQAGERGIRRAVIASSINAFGVPLNHHLPMPDCFPIDENAAVDLDDWYSLSKHTDEHTARMAASHWGISVLAIRFPFVQDEPGIRRHAAQMTVNERARLIREGWAYLDLRDAVAVVEAGLRADFNGAEIVNVAADDICLDEDTEVLLDRYAPGVRRLQPFPSRASLIDTTKARNLLGWRPGHSIHTSASGVAA